MISEEVSCFFCGETSSEQIVKGKKGFTCLTCENYNGFRSDGSYNKEIPEMFDSRLNLRGYFAREGDCSLPSRIFYDPFEFCPTCQRAQNRNPGQFRTCPKCRLKVISHLKKLDNSSENLYGGDSFENAVSSRFKRKKYRKFRQYGFFDKVVARIIHYGILSLVPIQVLYLCLLNYQMVIGVPTFGKWENFLWKVLILAIIPLFFRGFMYPFLMLMCIVWAPRFVSWVCRDKQILCGGNEQILSLAVSLCLTIFKLVKDEVKRVKICSTIENESERRQCYLYSNLFDEEDNQVGRTDYSEIENSGFVDMKSVTRRKKGGEIESRKKKFEKMLRRNSYSDAILLERKSRTVTGFIVNTLKTNSWLRGLIVFIFFSVLGVMILFSIEKAVTYINM